MNVSERDAIGLRKDLWSRLGKAAIDIYTQFTRTNRRHSGMFCSACRTDGNGCGSKKLNFKCSGNFVSFTNVGKQLSGGRREERERAKTVIIYAHMSKYIVSVFYAVSKCLFLLEIGDFSVIFEKKQRVQRL